MGRKRVPLDFPEINTIALPDFTVVKKNVPEYQAMHAWVDDAYDGSLDAVIPMAEGWSERFNTSGPKEQAAVAALLAGPLALGDAFARYEVDVVGARKGKVDALVWAGLALAGTKTDYGFPERMKMLQPYCVRLGHFMRRTGFPVEQFLATLSPGGG
jgi:hypothetical protein